MPKALKVMWEHKVTLQPALKVLKVHRGHLLKVHKVHKAHPQREHKVTKVI